VRRWLALGFALVCCAQALAAVTVVDDRGVHVRIAQPPQRIVSLLPSVTETICVLGACNRLVGVDDFSNWPAQVQALPHVGGLDDASIERIVALKPDLVLLGTSARAVARLEGLGIPVIGLDIKVMADVRKTMDRVAIVLGTGDAAAQWKRMQAGIAQAAQAMPPALRGTRVYVEVGGGYAAGDASHIGELLQALGVANVVPASLGSVPKLNPEFAVRADPQVLVAGASDMAELPGRPGWHRIRAVREKRFCALPPAERDIVMRPGPRMDEGAGILARCLQAAGQGLAR
jgi:iron complex transport system substrate-binding protein